jgi:hypothetical protein
VSNSFDPNNPYGNPNQPYGNPNNPYAGSYNQPGSPYAPGYQPPVGPPPSMAKVQAPAVALGIAAGLGIIMSIYSLIAAVIAKPPQIDPDAPEFVQNMMRGSVGPVAAVVQFLFIILNTVCHHRSGADVPDSYLGARHDQCGPDDDQLRELLLLDWPADRHLGAGHPAPARRPGCFQAQCRGTTVLNWTGAEWLTPPGAPAVEHCGAQQHQAEYDFLRVRFHAQQIHPVLDHGDQQGPDQRSQHFSLAA